MIVRKLRLKKGWSQEQLAELTDLSVRTVQRAERGHKMSLETARSFASVFEVKLSTFNQGESEMNTIQDTKTERTKEPIQETLLDDEKEAIQYIKGVKEFLTHSLLYGVFFVVLFAFKGGAESKLFWPLIGWGAGVFAHGVMAFELIQLPWQKWEKKMIEKRLGRKL